VFAISVINSTSMFLLVQNFIVERNISQYYLFTEYHEEVQNQIEDIHFDYLFAMQRID
jgi:hypothetical protein